MKRAGPRQIPRLCAKLGYKRERELLEDLYLRSHLSIRQVAAIIQRSYFAAKNRLQMYGIPLRPRGGPNRSGTGVPKI